MTNHFPAIPAGFAISSVSYYPSRLHGRGQQHGHDPDRRELPQRGIADSYPRHALHDRLILRDPLSSITIYG